MADETTNMGIPEPEGHSELIETDYDDFDPAGQHEARNVTTGGWTGFTDHYWMTTLIPGAGHRDAYRHDPGAYYNRVGGFLRQWVRG